MKHLLLVLLGGAVGAAVRYLIAAVAGRRLSGAFHWGTFLANMAACLILGFLVEAGGEDALGPSGQALLATGFCGALSTWSTFSHEVTAMADGRRVAGAAGYLLVTVVVGLGLSFAGAGVAAALW